MANQLVPMYCVRLAEWLDRQRSAQVQGRLPDGQQARLSAIGMQWANPEEWAASAEQLRAYHAKHGLFPDPRTRTPEAAALRKVQAARRRGNLSDELVAELDALGITWRRPAADWWEGYARLEDFHARTGHADVPVGHITDDKFALGTWIANTRAAYRGDRLSADRLDALEKLHFAFHAAEARWERGFAVAAAFYREHGNLRPPHDVTDNGVNLTEWLARQRKQRKAGKLDADREERLNAIGIEWQPVRSWEDRLAELREFHAQHGALPTQKTGRSLAGLLSDLRRTRRNGDLSAEIIAALDELGMDWDPFGTTRQKNADDTWRAGHTHLLAFHRREGHTRVRQSYVSDDGFPIGEWAWTTRIAYRKGKLSHEQVEALHRLGFAPDARVANWEHAFDVADAFYQAEGHLEPSPTYRSEGVTLGPWLSQQRRAQEDGTLDTDREARLTAIGIVWKYKYTWEQRLDQLREYHAEHGRLPTQRAHSILGGVLSKMRTARRNGELGAHIIAALDGLAQVFHVSV